MQTYTKQEIKQAKLEIKRLNERIRSIEKQGLTDSAEYIRARATMTYFEETTTSSGHHAIRNTIENAAKWLEKKNKGATLLPSTLSATHIKERAIEEMKAINPSIKKPSLTQVQDYLKSSRTLRDLIEEHAGERYLIAQEMASTNPTADDFGKAEEQIIEKYGLIDKLHQEQASLYTKPIIKG